MGNRAIHFCAHGNQSKIIEYLYSLRWSQASAESVLDLNSQNYRSETALHIAVYHGYVQVVKLLIKIGCNLNLQDCEGYSPLLVAVYRNNQTLVKILLDAHADLTITTKCGLNCIHIASMCENIG